MKASGVTLPPLAPQEDMTGLAIYLSDLTMEQCVDKLSRPIAVDITLPTDPPYRQVSVANLLSQARGPIGPSVTQR